LDLHPNPDPGRRRGRPAPDFDISRDFNARAALCRIPRPATAPYSSRGRFYWIKSNFVFFERTPGVGSGGSHHEVVFPLVSSSAAKAVLDGARGARGSA